MTLAFIACDKEDDIVAEGVKKEYIPEADGTELGDKVYDLYEKYGISFLYQFDRKIYDWTMLESDYSDNVLTYVQHPQNITTILEFLKENWLAKYPEEIIKTKFPIRVLFLDSIVYNSGDYSKDTLSWAGLNYLAIARMGDSFESTDKEKLLQSVNITLLADYLFAKGFFEVPQSFYRVSGEDMYGEFMDWGEDYSALYTENGFFIVYDYWGDVDSIYPQKKDDLRSYIDFIVRTPHTEVESIIGEYPKMMEKYNIIRNLLNSYGINFDE